jgi:signal transduction histidine kinase
MLLALIWWTILLYRKNHEAYNAKVDLIYLQAKQENKSVFTSEAFLEAQRDYKKQASMIMGEGVVFGLSLLIGIFLIQRAFEKELFISKKQNNFLLAVTHELKSPLTSINLGLETLKKRKLNHEMLVDVVDTSLLESKRLQNLIDQLLLTAKMDNKEIIYQLKDHNLSNLVNNYIKNFSLTRPDVSIDHSVDPDINIRIDAGAIETLLSNLVENAVKYANGNEINIQLKQVNDGVSLKVSDLGHGIPETEKKKIFEKFYRIGSEETRKTKGTGLGLYISKRIVDFHHGSISVANNKPTGSVFEVKLPITV